MLSILHYQERCYNEYVKLFSNLDGRKDNDIKIYDVRRDIQVLLIKDLLKISFCNKAKT